MGSSARAAGSTVLHTRLRARSGVWLSIANYLQKQMSDSCAFMERLCGLARAVVQCHVAHSLRTVFSGGLQDSLRGQLARAEDLHQHQISSMQDRCELTNPVQWFEQPPLSEMSHVKFFASLVIRRCAVLSASALLHVGWTGKRLREQGWRPTCKTSWSACKHGAQGN